MKLRVEARSIETAPEFGEPKGDGVAVLLEAHNHNLIGCPKWPRLCDSRCAVWSKYPGPELSEWSPDSSLMNRDLISSGFACTRCTSCGQLCICTSIARKYTCLRLGFGITGAVHSRRFGKSAWIHSQKKHWLCNARCTPEGHVYSLTLRGLPVRRRDGKC